MPFPAGQITATGVVGAGATITSKVYTNVLSFTVDCVNNTLTMFGPLPNNEPLTVDISGIAAPTWTVSGNKYTLVVA